jgi:hypothetical protein
VPAPLDQPEESVEDAAEGAAPGEYPVDVPLDETFPALDRLKGLVDLAENEKVGCGDGEKEERRNAGADSATDILEGDVAIRRRSGGERDQDRK